VFSFAALNAFICFIISKIREHFNRFVPNHAAGKCTLARDEIHGFAVMICQACGLDKKIPRTKFSEFFGRGRRTQNPQFAHNAAVCQNERLRELCPNCKQFGGVLRFWLTTKNNR
jgi:hypothetical protein